MVININYAINLWHIKRIQVIEWFYELNIQSYLSNKNFLFYSLVG